MRVTAMGLNPVNLVEGFFVCDGWMVPIHNLIENTDFKLTPLSDESDPPGHVVRIPNRKQAEEVFTLFSLLYVFR